MGNGSSVVASSTDLPEKVDKDTAKKILGDDFDETKFDSLAKEGTVEKEEFRTAIQDSLKDKKVKDEPPSEVDEVKVEKADEVKVGKADEVKVEKADEVKVEKAPDAATEALHSKLRWNKEGTVQELEKMFDENPTLLHAFDKNNGNYPLHIAAQNGFIDLVKVLISKKADPNKQNGQGQTALHMTNTYAMYEISTLLKEAGADETIKNQDGHTAAFGLEGKHNYRYDTLSKILESPSEASLQDWFTQAMENRENLEKVKIMQLVTFQVKKKLKADGSWTDAVNTKYTAMIRAFP